MTYLGPRVIGNFKAAKYRFTKAESDYFSWLHDDPICVLTGQTEGINIAHVGGIGEGKGMGLKCPPIYCLPIIWKLHHVEEKNREWFWHGAGFPDYIAWAERLHDLHTTGQSKFPLVYEMNERANRDFIRKVLTR